MPAQWDERDFRDALGDVFGFYSAELQSHAATAASFAIVFLALLTIKPVDIRLTVLWLLAIAGLATAISFSLLRLFIYGAHSAAILWGNWKEVWDLRDEMITWEVLLPHTQVAVYSSWYFQTYTLPRKYFKGLIRLDLIFNENAHPKTGIVIALWILFFAGTLILVFWDFVLRSIL